MAGDAPCLVEVSPHPVVFSRCFYGLRLSPVIYAQRSNQDSMGFQQHGFGLMVATPLRERFPFQEHADLLGISVDTVRMHTRVLYRKLSVTGRVGVLVRLVLAHRDIERKRGLER